MKKIGIIGLGYVGLPLAIEFGKKYEVVGFDINQLRIDELKKSSDRTREVDSSELQKTTVVFTSDEKELDSCNFFIITVPTPVTNSKQPDLSPLVKASELVAKHLKKGDIVVYESTVYPGCTEEICVPIIEKHSGLKYNTDFFCGYSPERINPGDHERSLVKIMKVTSGSTPQVAEEVDRIYSSIVKVGTYKASSIKVAEAAKVIENTQRDINIAFINELSIIFSRLGLDTREVLDAASTKWNFLKFTPGLVGGHCIGVDPYYLTHKAESLGYHPQVILSGRRINDGMGAHVANQTIKLMTRKNISLANSKVLILGITFKENCPDVRNSKVIDVINELKDFGCHVDVYDPHALKDEVEHEYKISPVNGDIHNRLNNYDAIVITVGHNAFKDFPWASVQRNNKVIFDVKGVLTREMSDGRL
jgi:UDP-N-acetyl-D-galactosamine dehydrogenase